MKIYAIFILILLAPIAVAQKRVLCNQTSCIEGTWVYDYSIAISNNKRVNSSSNIGNVLSFRNLANNDSIEYQYVKQGNVLSGKVILLSSGSGFVMRNSPFMGNNQSVTIYENALVIRENCKNCFEYHFHKQSFSSNSVQSSGNSQNAQFEYSSTENLLIIRSRNRFNSSINVRIINMLGQTVLTKTFGNSSMITIDTSPLRKGVYMVNVTGGNVSQTFRILTGE
jgi:hypothetical protein